MTREEIYAPTPLNTHVYSVEVLRKAQPEDYWESVNQFPDDTDGLDAAKEFADKLARQGVTVKVFRVNRVPPKVWEHRGVR